ncbi:5-hydroxytryptamine receptor 3A-like [Polyodon spathula]|uniref:5-hydroxytryptamine receptor 3A-like n=1 Tax=Polyodon spathula TaxID=7913 RepID=UPI001B7EED77|nr:5-hydroxytryptamine receptor 3A-like [Polyodon spathula]
MAELWTAYLFICVAVSSATATDKVCSYYDVYRYLNLSQSNELLTSVRPVKDWRTPTTVHLAANIYAILGVVEKTQVFTSFFQVQMHWKNEFLFWDKDQFCGIKSITVPYDLLWKPDIRVLEFIDEDVSLKEAFLSIRSNGMVVINKTLRIVSTCTIFAKQFPFDEQNCNLTFLSYQYLTGDIQLESEFNSSEIFFFSKNYIESEGEWELKGITVFQSSLNLEKEPLATLVYQVSLKRKYMLYVLNLLVPAAFLLMLDLASYFIPEPSGEKLGFKITVILGFSVLQLLLSGILPSNGRIPPLIAIIFASIFTFMLLSLLQTIFVKYLWNLKPDSCLLRGFCRKQKPSTDQFKDSGNQEDSVKTVSINLGQAGPDSSVLREMLLEIQTAQQMVIGLQREKETVLSLESAARALDTGYFYLYLMSVVSFFTYIAVSIM